MKLNFGKGKDNEKISTHFHHAAKDDDQQNDTAKDPVKTKCTEAVYL